MVETLQAVVRILHIVFGVAWVGSALYAPHAVFGGLRKTPPQVMGPAMMAIQEKTLTFHMVVGPATILFGVWNQYLMAGSLSFSAGPWNRLLGAALVLGVVTMGIGFGHNLPTFRRMKATLAASGGRPTAEVESLRKRMMAAGIVMTLLMVTALVLMVLAVLQGPTRVA